MRIVVAMGLMAITAGASTLEAQATHKASLEARVGAAVPTFDIADAVKAGFAFGAGLGIPLGGRWHLLADVDYGKHSGKRVGNVTGPDFGVTHLMGKLGFEVTPPSSKVKVILNAGGGLLSFNPDATNASSNSYFAINAGAKIYLPLGSDRVSLVLSPQGDIAFSKKTELGSSTAWVWPFTAGLRVRL